MDDRNDENSPRPRDGRTRNRPTEGGLPSALLLGSDQTDLGEVTIREVCPSLAIGISRGRFPKGYPHVDPNEDAVFGASDRTTAILAVADGHNGFDAANAAIRAISDGASDAIEAPLSFIIDQLASAAIAAVAEIVANLPPPRNASRTSLTVAAVRDGTVAAATIGDTAGFVATHRRPRRLGRDTSFLSIETEPEAIDIVSTKLPVGCSVILATDGFLDFATDATRALRSAAQLSASAAADHLVSVSFSGGAGDNVAVAAYRQP